jgi:hypothetical protein
LTGPSYIDTIPNPEVEPQATAAIFWDDGIGWYDPTTEEPAGGVIIYPGTAVKVLNYATGDPLPVVMVGEVKLTKTQVDVFPSENWLGQPNPTGGTLGSMQFGTQITELVDVLELFAPDTPVGQPSVAYIAFDGTMLKLDDESDASDVEIGAGLGYLITRPGSAAGGEPSVITIPAQVVSP